MLTLFEKLFATKPPAFSIFSVRSSKSSGSKVRRKTIPSKKSVEVVLVEELVEVLFFVLSIRTSMVQFTLYSYSSLLHFPRQNLFFLLVFLFSPNWLRNDYNEVAPLFVSC